MKPILQAVLILGLAMPVFSAVPSIDFDGTHDRIQGGGFSSLKNLLSQQFIIPSPGVGMAPDGVAFESRQELSTPLKDSAAAPAVETKMLRIIENGVAVEVPATVLNDGRGYFKFFT